MIPESAEDRIVENLIAALERLREDLDRVELWAVALGCFQAAAPEYQPENQYLLPLKPEDRKSRSARGSKTPF